MASPPPNYSQESTYSQPAVPVEMKVFQGGGIDESLYDQPMKPVPLTEFRGGGGGDGDENVSPAGLYGNINSNFENNTTNSNAAKKQTTINIIPENIEKFRGLSIQEIADSDKSLLDMMFIIHIYQNVKDLSDKNISSFKINNKDIPIIPVAFGEKNFIYYNKLPEEIEKKINNIYLIGINSIDDYLSSTCTSTNTASVCINKNFMFFYSNIINKGNFNIFFKKEEETSVTPAAASGAESPTGTTGSETPADSAASETAPAASETAPAASETTPTASGNTDGSVIPPASETTEPESQTTPTEPTEKTLFSGLRVRNPESIKSEIKQLKFNEDEQTLFNSLFKVKKEVVENYVKKNSENFFDFWKLIVDSDISSPYYFPTKSESDILNTFYNNVLENYRTKLFEKYKDITGTPVTSEAKEVSPVAVAQVAPVATTGAVPVTGTGAGTGAPGTGAGTGAPVAEASGTKVEKVKTSEENKDDEDYNNEGEDNNEDDENSEDAETGTGTGTGTGTATGTGTGTGTGTAAAFVKSIHGTKSIYGRVRRATQRGGSRKKYKRKSSTSSSKTRFQTTRKAR
jgi:hypothetical protein